MPETTTLSRTTDPQDTHEGCPSSSPPRPGLRPAACSLPDGPRRSRLVVSLPGDHGASTIDEEPSCKTSVSG
jgi:hypothetical protein